MERKSAMFGGGVERKKTDVDNHSQILLDILLLLRLTSQGQIRNSRLIRHLLHDLHRYLIDVALRDVKVGAEDAGESVGSDELFCK